MQKEILSGMKTSRTMNTILLIIRWVVGILFIISGLVKANDPLGLSYKMQEFFELWSGSIKQHTILGLLDFLHHDSLALAIGMITLEVVAGVALLVAWRKNFILTLLLILILFF